MNRIYMIGYTVNGKRRLERISAPDMQTAEREWKNWRHNINYTGFTIHNPDHSRF